MKSLIVLSGLFFYLFIASCSKKGDVNRYLKSAIHYIDKGEYNRAIKVLDLALASDSISSIAFTLKGKVLSILEQYDLAKVNLTKAICLDSQNTSAFFYKAGLYSNLNIEDSALLFYNMALDSKKRGEYYFVLTVNFDVIEEEKQVALDVIYFNRGITLYELGQLKSALSDFRYALRKGFEISLCNLYIGDIMLTLGDKSGCDFLISAFKDGVKEADTLIKYYNCGTMGNVSQ